MAKSHIDQFVESIVGRFAGDLWAVVMQNGMTLDEYERHVGLGELVSFTSGLQGGDNGRKPNRPVR